MNYTNFHLHNEHMFYPDNYVGVKIITRHSRQIYEYVRFVRFVSNEQPDAPFKLKQMLDAHIIECRVKGEKHSMYFAFIRTKKGLYVGNIMKSFKISPVFEDNYSRYMNIPYTLPELIAKDELEYWLKVHYGFDNVERPLVDDELRLFNGKTFNRRVFKEYMDWYKTWHRGKTYKQKTVYLRPDFRLVKQRSIIELEVTLHEEYDFYWKLLRIKGLDRKTLFIFNDLEHESSYENHCEYIASFERITGRKFRYLYVARYSDFIALGDKAFVNFRHLAV